ncbi:hypothetical protein BVRB_029530, partial [Beta vulgaris subsp. vulgaris]
MSVKWVSTFIKQLTAMLPGGIIPIGILNGQAEFTSLLEFSVEQSKDVTITKTNSVPLAKLQSSQHQIDFLLPTLQTRTELATIGRFEGTFTGIAYALPQASLADAADALQADLIQ